MTVHVLIVDDERAMCESLAAALTAYGFESAWCTSADEALGRLDKGTTDVVVADINMRGMNGIELCSRIVANRPDIPVIVMTAFGSLELAVQTIRAGAFDFIAKPFDPDDMILSIERAAKDRTVRTEVRLLRNALATSRPLDEITGSSQAILAVRDLVARVAPTDVNVLIVGESGTGKELVARALHGRSANTSGPFVAINCAAIPESLLEAELFGHVKGAFTDAKGVRRGLLVEANGGTLFLDELGDMPLAMQAKLLRALEQRVVRPVGGNTEVPFSARIVAATNRDLEAGIAEKTFREDLYYRINVVRIDLPPLRARAGDVLLLAQHFVKASAERLGKNVVGFSSAVAQRFLSYAWPGNVRELQNCIDRAVALTRFEELTVDDLPDRIKDYKSTPIVVAAEASELVTLDELDRRYVLRVLESVGGKRVAAARILGVDRTTLYRMLQRYGIRSDA